MAEVAIDPPETVEVDEQDGDRSRPLAEAVDLGCEQVEEAPAVGQRRDRVGLTDGDGSRARDRLRGRRNHPAPFAAGPPFPARSAVAGEPDAAEDDQQAAGADGEDPGRRIAGVVEREPRRREVRRDVEAGGPGVDRRSRR